jgi:hypothetical protein
MWYKLFAVVLSAYFVWRLFIYIKANPRAFSKDKLSRSFLSMGVLALLLMGFVALLVYIVRQG